MESENLVRYPVEFVDAETGNVIANSRLTIERLTTNCFRPPTLLIDGGRWVLVRVEPAELTHVATLGRARLTLRRVADLTMKELLFSQPTICDRVPPLAKGSQRAGRVLDLHEDDWRQVEFVSLVHQQAVEDCLANVREVIAEERASLGWRRLHTRREVPSRPIAIRIPLEWIHRRFRNPEPYAGLSFPGLQPLIAGGFALETPAAIAVYGVVEEGSVTTLGLRGWGSGGELDRDVLALQAIAKTYELGLVDWCRGVHLMPSDFASYFSQRSA